MKVKKWKEGYLITKNMETAVNKQQSKNLRKKSKRYDTNTQVEVLTAHASGELVSSIAKRFGMHPSTIYAWINALNESEKTDKPKKSATVEKANSIAKDFGVSREVSSSVDLKFCPCCGTNIKAVRIALETCQQINGH
jgi:DNA-binding transcriptional ArsR family regulator